MPDASSEMLSLAQFRAAVADAVVPLDVLAERSESFLGHLGAAATGDIHLLSLAAAAHSVHRTPALIERSNEDYLKFTLVERGTAMIVQDGRDTMLERGDMAIYDTTRPYSLLFDERVHLSLLMFPRTLLRVPVDVIARTTATRLSGTNGVGAMIRPYLASLVARAGDVDAHTAGRLARNAVDMVGTLVESTLPSLPRTAPAHRDVMHRILGYIDENLASPELAPAQIAAAHFISLRHLHGLFSEYGASVSTVIRTRRLERCYDELVDPRHSGRSVSTIAMSNGFVDSAHFSRLFRAHFGVPPSAARERAL
ncbi:MAG TPA: helix-turn-helix domain-containing protein [Microbacterium sp.]|nr:helix-turn-helix domain-containing protein [Microbacterium sp.]